jgi:pyruvate dehydrogenase phosphatase
MKYNSIIILLFIISFKFIYNEAINNIIDYKKIPNELLSQLNIIDDYEDFAFGAQLGANAPCEDAFFIQNITLLNYEGIFLSVFDGHGGDKLSKYANLLLYPYFLESFNLNKFEPNLNRRIILSLKQAYERIEHEFLKIAFNERLNHNYLYSQVGTCAISAIIINKKIFVANLGDSKARLFYISNKRIKNKNDVEEIKVKKLSKVFNIRKKSEQIAYRAKFPKDKDIIQCYDPKACYVKGALQPTRTLGDYSLKYLYFNLNDISDNSLYEKYQKYFNGPYISSVPDIQILDIKNNFKYLIMGTDGLWDVVKSREIASIINTKFDNAKNITYELMNMALIKYSLENNMNGNFSDILKMPKGRERRNMHDDITIITCDLRKYF